MTKRITLAVAFLLAVSLLCTVLAPVQTTVSGNLSEARVTDAPVNNTHSRFTLLADGDVIPKVSGTNVVVSLIKDFFPDANWNISGTIQGNDMISLGSSPTGGTQYLVCVVGQAQPTCKNHTIVRRTLDLNSATPNTTSQTIRAPGEGSIYIRKDRGKNIYNCQNFNNVRCVDETNSSGWAGTDVCAQIASAIGDLNSAGGVIDARSILTDRSCSGNPFAGVTKPVTLLLPGRTFTLNVKWTVAANDILVQGTGERNTVLLAGAGLTNSPIVEMGDNTDVFFGMRFEDLRINCNLNTGSTGILMRGLNEESGIREVLVSHYLTNGIKVDGTVQNTGDFEISNSEVTTSASAGAAGDGILLLNTQGQIRVVRASIVADNLQTSAGIHNASASTNNFFENNHIEKYADGVLCDGGALHMLGFGGFAGTVNTLHIKTGCNTVFAGDILNNGNSDSDSVILNDISGTNLSSLNPPSPGGAVSLYAFSAGWSEFWIDANGVHYNSNSSGRPLTASNGGLSLGAGSVFDNSGAGGTMASVNQSQTWSGNQTNMALVTPTIGGGTTLTRYARYTPSLSPSSVAANTTAEQCFANILTSGDFVIGISKPTAQAGLGIVGWRANGTSACITFSNNTTSPITPTTNETYQIVAVQ